MPHASPKQPLFVDAIEIPARLEADRSTPYEERVHRDRTIAAAIGSPDPLARVREWNARIPQDRLPAEGAPTARRLVRARRLISVTMFVLGVLAGAAVSSAVLRYDGTWPVNVVTVLATLVLLQVVLVVFTLIMMAPRVPGLSSVQELLAGFNPGALAASFYRRIRGRDEGGADLLVWHEARGPIAARFARWQMLTWSQVAALAFNVAALATAAGLIAFTDLAFGWSTTLQVSSDEAVRITNALSAPWRELWPAAVPSLELIEASRFFRLTSAPANQVPAGELTGWWPFLLAAMLTYGLVPRFVLFILASMRLQAATRRLLLDDPRVRALLDRMGATEIQLGATDAERLDASPPSRAVGAPPSGAEGLAVVWSGAIASERVGTWSETHLKRRIADVLAAGGGGLDEDRAAVERAAKSEAGVILIFVRAWEAPVLDLKDFLTMLRERVGMRRSIVIVPVAENGERASDTQSAVWSRWTARAGDSSMYVESGA